MQMRYIILVQVAEKYKEVITFFVDKENYYIEAIDPISSSIPKLSYELSEDEWVAHAKLFLNKHIDINTKRFGTYEEIINDQKSKKMKEKELSKGSSKAFEIIIEIPQSLPMPQRTGRSTAATTTLPTPYTTTPTPLSQKSPTTIIQEKPKALAKKKKQRKKQQAKRDKFELVNVEIDGEEEEGKENEAFILKRR